MALIVTRVRVHHAGVRRMLAQQFMVDELDRRMQRARLLGIVIAPVDTGNYVARFLRVDAVQSGVNARGVAYARLINDAKRPQAPGGFSYALALEAGTRYMRAQRILRRALRAVED